jgi:2-polyprenyl-6-hydroxyphenyl methylase/3-demethylubiquinone-9 3-methyltransferase
MDSGIILLSTLLQPADIDRQGLSWWYAAPRNGHVSLYSATSLEKLAERFGFQIHSLDQSYHVLYRQNANLVGHSKAG